MVSRGRGGRWGGELRGWVTRRRRGGGGVVPTDAGGVGSGRGLAGAKGRKNGGMGRGDRGRSGLVKPGVPWGRGRGMDLIRDGAAYGVELQLHVVVVLAMLVMSVAIGFVLEVETGLDSGLPEVFDRGSDGVCDSVVGGGGWRFVGRSRGW